MLKGFRDFILRGNVVELATAVIIGGAFTAIVTAVSDNIINPLIASFGSADVGGLGFPLRPGNDATFLDFGAVITAVLNFLIVAAVVYFIIVLPMNKLEEWRTRNAPEEEVPESQEDLLAQIRDLLAAQQPASPAATPNTIAGNPDGNAPRH